MTQHDANEKKNVHKEFGANSGHGGSGRVASKHFVDKCSGLDDREVAPPNRRIQVPTRCRRRFMEFPHNLFGRFRTDSLRELQDWHAALAPRNSVRRDKLRALQRLRKPGRDYRDL